LSEFSAFLLISETVVVLGSGEREGVVDWLPFVSPENVLLLSEPGIAFNVFSTQTGLSKLDDASTELFGGLRSLISDPNK